MSSDPAKHAETVRELLIYADSCGDEDVLRDGNELAAYLDSLPGDGGELADVEWLEEIGVPHLSQFSGNGAYYFMPLQLRVSFESVDGDATLITPTRSQVRHLLCALTPATGGE